MEQYLEAADAILDAAIANGPRPTTLKRRLSIKDERTVKPTGSVYRHLDDVLKFLNGDGAQPRPTPLGPPLPAK